MITGKPFGSLNIEARIISIITIAEHEANTIPTAQILVHIDVHADDLKSLSLYQNVPNQDHDYMYFSRNELFKILTFLAMVVCVGKKSPGGGGGGVVADLNVLTKAIEYPVSTLCNNIGKKFPTVLR